MTRNLVLVLLLGIVTPNPVRSEECLALGDMFACDGLETGTDLRTPNVGQTDVQIPAAGLPCMATGDMACE